MNYNCAVSRSKMDEQDTAICVHGLEKSFCGYCQGTNWEKKKIRKESNVEGFLALKYEELKSKFKNYKEDWTEDEFFEVYANLKDVRGTKAELKGIYHTALVLSRTKGAVRWAMEHLFSEKEYHRGKIVIEFRQTFGLDKNAEKI